MWKEGEGLGCSSNLVPSLCVYIYIYAYIRVFCSLIQYMHTFGRGLCAETYCVCRYVLVPESVCGSWRSFHRPVCSSLRSYHVPFIPTKPKHVVCSKSGCGYFVNRRAQSAFSVAFASTPNTARFVVRVFTHFMSSV